MLLTATGSAAPMEEKEREEIEAVEEGEEELSEEEEGGTILHTSTLPKGLASIGPFFSHGSNGGAERTTAAISSDGREGNPDVSVISSPAVAGLPVDSAGSSGGSPGVQSQQKLEPSGELTAAGSSSQSELTGYDAPETEINGNGQKLLNVGGAHDQTGVLEPLGGVISHLDYTGVSDQSNHDFLLGLMGGVDPFGKDVHAHITEHKGVPSHLDPTVKSLVPGLELASSDLVLIPGHLLSSSTDPDSTPEPAGPAHHTDLSSSHSGLDQTFLSSGPDQSSLSSVSGFSPAPSSSAGQAAIREHHTPSPYPDVTALWPGLRRDVTGAEDSSHVLLHTESPDHSSFTHSLTLHSEQLKFPPAGFDMVKQMCDDLLPSLKLNIQHTEQVCDVHQKSQVREPFLIEGT
ncbi:uncharacterized protein si:ch211-80h18.1 [Lampris incognitus]|uniref:uncharacterized protein si:ch211-80h18.1 n=1 Tax=Lampris incognitus TaxID=2546036 RepID=UPI0024B60F3A|nr:uncharacterized protein si:ch211-80h18.1 [Lampris incognitus]